MAITIGTVQLTASTDTAAPFNASMYWTAALAAGDLNLGCLLCKPYSVTIATMPTGWTPLGSTASGTATSAAEDQGSVHLELMWKQKTTEGTSSDVYATSSALNPAISGGVRARKTAAGAWVAPVAAFGADSDTSTAAVDATLGATLDFTAGDTGVVFLGSSYSASLVTAVAVDIPGCTIDAVVSVTTASTTLSTNLREYIYSFYVTSGTATGPLRLTASTGATPAASSVAVGAIRLREPGVPPVIVAATAATVAADSPIALVEQGVASTTKVAVNSPASTFISVSHSGAVTAGLEVSVPTSAVLRAMTPAQAASESGLAQRVPVEVQVWDPRNTAMLAIMDGRMDPQWLDDLNDVGSGQFGLSEYDFKSTLENLALFNLAKFVYAGKVRFSSRIEKRELAVAGSDDYAGQMWTVSGRGTLSLLADAVLYSEYGIDEFTRKERSFFFGSREGAWYIPSEWFPPRELPLASVPADHPWHGHPSDWPDPDAKWIWSTDPNAITAPGPAWFRSYFSLAATATVKVFATADDEVTLYVDGYPALAMGSAGEATAFTRSPAQFSIRMGPGPHLIAAEVRNHTETIPEVQPVVTGGEITPAFSTSGNMPYIGKGFSDGGHPYVNSDGSVDGGGPGSAVFDGNPDTYWLSVGNYLGWTSIYEYVEGTFAATNVTAVRVHVRGGPYTAYISLKNGGNDWNGGSTVPYKARVVNAGANIRYVATYRIEKEQNATINVPPQMADRVRVTLRADWDSGLWNYRWRASIREITVTNENREGSYIRGGNFGGLLVTVASVDDKGAVTGIIHRSQTQGWLCHTGTEPGWMPVHIITKLLEEARLRNVLGPLVLKLGFTDVVDSYGRPWTTPRKRVKFNTGADYLTIFKKLAEDSRIDIWIDPGALILHAAERRGTDRTAGPATIILQPGQSLTDFSVESGRPQATRLVVESPQGWMEVGDFEGETTYGRIEGFASLGSALTVEEARTSADNELSRFATESWDSSITSTDVHGPLPYVDYGVGDFIKAPIGIGTGLGINRVLSMRVAEGAQGSALVDVELDRELTVPALTSDPPPPPDPGVPPADPDVGVPAADVPLLQAISALGVRNPGDTMTASVYTVGAAGAAFDRIRFDRLVKVGAQGATFTNCWFEGIDGNPADSALLEVLNTRPGPAVPSASAARCTFRPAHPDNHIDGVRGSNFSLGACEISGTVDGIHQFGVLTGRNDAYAGNITVADCWIHDLLYYDDGSHPGSSITGTHNDGAHINGGGAMTLLRTRFDGTMTDAGVYASQAYQAITALTIQECSFGPGSAAAINVYDAGGTGAVQGLSIVGCTFDAATTRYTMLVSGRTLDHGAPYIQGNIWTMGRQPPPRITRGA